MSTLSTGKILMSLSGSWAAVGPYVFDWNETHIYNPNWPPHAKFHNAQTMSTGAALGALALYTTWLHPGPWTRGRLQTSTAFASLYWVTQLAATVYPGTALVDHPHRPDTIPAGPPDTIPAGSPDTVPATPAATPAKLPRFLGPQPIISGVGLALNALAYGLERRRLARFSG